MAYGAVSETLLNTTEFDREYETQFTCAVRYSSTCRVPMRGHGFW